MLPIDRQKRSREVDALLGCEVLQGVEIRRCNQSFETERHSRDAHCIGDRAQLNVERGCGVDGRPRDEWSSGADESAIP